MAVALTEGWRGEICHAAITGPDGRLAAYKVVDPSFSTWPALGIALADVIVPDFPLANKSFNCSYSGVDLCADGIPPRSARRRGSNSWPSPCWA